MTQELKTLQEWALEDRTVIAGSTAGHYARFDQRWLALFGPDQVQERVPVSRAADADEIVTCEEYQERKKPQTLPKVKVEQEGDWIFVWVGNNPKAIGFLKRNKYRFIPERHRWTARRPGRFDEIVAAFTSQGYDVSSKVVS